MSARALGGQGGDGGLHHQLQCSVTLRDMGQHCKVLRRLSWTPVPPGCCKVTIPFHPACCHQGLALTGSTQSHKPHPTMTEVRWGELDRRWFLLCLWHCPAGGCGWEGVWGLCARPRLEQGGEGAGTGFEGESLTQRKIL